MANNIEGANAAGTNRSIDKGNGNVLSNLTNNLLFARTFGGGGGNGGGNDGESSSRGRRGRVPTVEELNATANYNDSVAKIHANASKQEHKQGMERDAAKTSQKIAKNDAKTRNTERLIRTAAKNGSPSSVKNGKHQIDFHPQQKGQQQKNVRTTSNTQTAADRTPLIIQSTLGNPAKRPTKTQVNQQNKAADSYTVTPAPGKNLTRAQQKFNNVMDTYKTTP